MAELTLEVAKKRAVRFSDRHFQLLARKIVKAIRPDFRKHTRVHLSLVWVGDKDIRKINHVYRGKDAPTDVLSFSFLERTKLGHDGLLGELIISVDTLKKQSKQQRHAMATEADVLFVHGLLHILGYDHETPVDLKRMLGMEKKFLGDKAGLIARSLGEPQMGSHKNRRQP